MTLVHLITAGLFLLTTWVHSSMAYSVDQSYTASIQAKNVQQHGIDVVAERILPLESELGEKVLDEPEADSATWYKAERNTLVFPHPLKLTIPWNRWQPFRSIHLATVPPRPPPPASDYCMS